MEVSISTNAIDAKHWLDSLARSQLPFAISRTVNLLAWDIRDNEQDKLNQYFEIRTRWITKKGAMPVIKSDKKQAPDIHSIIGVNDEITAMSITGGVRRGEGGNDMAVPLVNTGAGITAREILNPAKRTLTKTKWPSNIVKENKRIKRKSRGNRKPKPFYLTAANGEKFVAIRQTNKRLPLTFLYHFASRVTIEKQWPLIENATAQVSSDYDKVLSKEIDRAINTMRV